MQDETLKTLFAIAGIVALEIAALMSGIDGVALSACIALLAGLGGYNIAKAKK